MQNYMRFPSYSEFLDLFGKVLITDANELEVRTIAMERDIEETPFIQSITNPSTFSLLVQIKTSIIGNKEDELFLRLIEWIEKQKKKRNSKEVILVILLPEQFDTFTPAFISSLYLLKHKITNIKIYLCAHSSSGREFELQDLINTGKLSLSSENDLFCSILNGNPNSYNVSSKILPLILLSEESFFVCFCEKFAIFKKAISEIIDGKVVNLCNSSQKSAKDEDKVYQQLRQNVFGGSYTSKLPNKKHYYLLHYFRLLLKMGVLSEELCEFNDNIIPQYQNSVYFKGVKKILNDLHNKPLFFILLFQVVVDAHGIKEPNKHLSSLFNNKDQLGVEAVSRINNLFTYVSKIFNGLYEIAKNIIEHSEKQTGIITVRTFTAEQIKQIKNDDRKAYWNKYFNDTNANSYIDISITDNGRKGIIEKSLDDLFDEKILEKLFNNKEFCEDVKVKIKKDMKLITERLSSKKSPRGSGVPESELLYDMYFNPAKIMLDRQAIKALASYGLFIFTSFVRECKGFLYACTNKANNQKGTIGFLLQDKMKQTLLILHIHLAQHSISCYLLWITS